MPTIQLPFPYLKPDELDGSDFAEKLRRNFEAVGQQITSSSSGFDAFIDPTQASDATKNRFINVGAALAALPGDLTLGFVHTTTVVTETGALAFGTRKIRCVGLGAFQQGAIYQQWDLAGFLATGNSASSIVQIENMRVLNSGALIATLFPGILIAYNSEVLQSSSGGTLTNVTDVAPTAFLGVNVFWQGMNMSNGNTMRVHLMASVFQNRTNGLTVIAGTHDVYLHGGFSADSTGLTFNNSGKTIIDVVDALDSTGTNNSITITLAGGGNTFFRAFGRTTAFQLHLTVANTCGDLVLEGYFGTLTVAAASNFNTIRRISGAARSGMDITGPAQIDLTNDGDTSTNGVVIRGARVIGELHIISGNNTGALQLIGATDCLLKATVKNPNVAGTTKPYAIDATGARNIVMISGSNNGWGVAGTNADATTSVITEAGVPIGTGAAGGSLAGAYPSPTFAGRFPSVAELDKDFTKAFLFGG